MNPDKSQPDDELNKKNQPADEDPGFEVIDELSDDDAAAAFLADDTNDPPAKPEEFAEIGQVAPPRTPETSAIDLRTQEMIELPFEMPDDDLLSDTEAPPRLDAPLSDRSNDSGRLDLDGSGTLVNPSDITRAGPDAVPRPSSPDTDKLRVPKRRSSSIISGMVGGLVGVGICAAVWFSGVLDSPKKPQTQIATQPPAAAPKPNPAIESTFALLESSDFDGAAAAIEADHPNVAKALRDLAAKAKTDAERLKKAQADITAMRDEMAKAKPDADGAEEIARLKNELNAAQAMAKAAKTDAAASEAKAAASTTVAEKAEQTAKVFETLAKNAEKDAAGKIADAEEAKKTAEEELKKVRDQLANMKPAAPAADPAEIAKLKTDAQQAGAKAAALNEKLVTANNKLLTANNQLAAVNKKLAEAEAKPRADLPPLPSAVYRADAVADRMFATGLYLYRNNQLFEAEREFENAIKENDRDARYWYFLGLSRLALGNTDQAAKDFREGAEREKRNLPGSATIDRSLERLPMDARQTLAQYRK